MNEEAQQKIMLATVQSMITELDSRLGDDNPWRRLDLSGYTASELGAVKRLLHELLYAPPSRGS